MEPKEFQKYIRELEIKLFPESAENEVEMDVQFYDRGGRYSVFTPNQSFSPESPLLTEGIIKDLKDNKKTLLSVGSGPAYLERLLVQGLGVDKEQIILADLLPDKHPEGYNFVKFDMHKKWPIFDKKIDYVIFPDSTLLHKFGMDLYGTENIKEKHLQHLVYNAVQRLTDPRQAPPDPVGEIRIKNHYNHMRKSTASSVLKFIKNTLNEHYKKRKMEMQYTDKFVAFTRY